MNEIEILKKFDNLVVEELSPVFSGEIKNNTLIYDFSMDSFNSFLVVLKAINNLIENCIFSEFEMEYCYNVNKCVSVEIVASCIIISLKDYSY